MHRSLRFFLALSSVLLVAATCVTCAAPQQLDVPSRGGAIENALRSTVILLQPHKLALLCAGEYVGPRTVLTAAHCIPGAVGVSKDTDPTALPIRWLTFQNWSVSNFDGVSRGRVAYTDSARDIAVLLADERASNWAELVERDPLVGQEVINIGHPNGALFVLGRGYVTAVHVEARDEYGRVSTYTRASIDVWRGSSGGGLYDEHGRLLGVASLIGDDRGKVAFYVDLPPIREAIVKAQAAALRAGL